jgi:hypothetical protein
MDGVSTAPPKTSEEITAARELLDSDDESTRQRAVLALALAGDLWAYRELLADRDLRGLCTYAGFYRNPEGHSCLDEDIENAVPSGMEDPELARCLLGFFPQNLYRQRSLFDRLNRIRFGDFRPDDFPRTVMALTSTNLDGIEAQVLANARASMAHDTPVRKRVLPAAHRHFVEFFADRGYDPAIGYMEDLLAIESWDEATQHLVAEYSVTRSTVYRALSRFPSPLVGDVFVRQLDRLATSCPPELLVYELSAFGRFAVTHAFSEELRRRVAESLATVLGLGPEQDPGTALSYRATDYRTHKIVVELLAELGTSDAARILIRDLEKVTGMQDRSLAESMTISTLEALRALPTSTELEVPRLIQAARGLPPYHALITLPEILDAHPDAAAHAFYLDQLTWIAEHPDVSWTSSAIDADRALDAIMTRLLAFEEPQQLESTRNEVDRLFEAGLLDERRFLRASATINPLLGTTSTVYLELAEQQRLEREAETSAKLESESESWLRITDDNLSPAGIRRNLELLERRDSNSRTAAAWLIIAGPKILPAAHPMLVDPETSPDVKFALLQVLGEIGHSSSESPVIEVIRRHSDSRGLLKAGLYALALMPATDLSRRLIGDLLDAGQPLVARQQALVYLAAVRDGDALAIARRYAAPGAAPEMRVVALLLAARLGDDSVLATIRELLPVTDDRSQREVLLRALGELSDPGSFAAFTNEHRHVVPAESVRKVETVVAFRRAEGNARIDLARQMIHSGHPWDRWEAVAFLVEGNHVQPLSELLLLNPYQGLPLLATVAHSPTAVAVLAQIRRMGYRVEETPEGLAIVAGR